ncbi:MAG: hypothetical protein E6G49_00870 [Actinobacteria bacterium]|nr:MAG: hypothetical protein E6G49_00870 [Actinomycetota bacterium]
MTQPRASSRRPAMAAVVLLPGLVAILLAGCGSGSRSSTATTTGASTTHAGNASRGKGTGPGRGPGAPPATRTSHPRKHTHNQGPPGSQMHRTYAGRIISHALAEGGAVQPAELSPVTNGWRISDHRTFTAVYAGAVPDHRSTGRLVIFRQNFVRVSQTSDHVNVPGSGPLRITGAPQGNADQTAAQRSGTLEFKGANGTTGTLHLSNDTVTVG